MSLTAAIEAGRAAAEALMNDECQVKRRTGKATDADGKVTDAYREIYSGACKVAIRDVDPSTPEAGGRLSTVTRLRVDLPVDDSLGVQVNDVVTIISAEFDEDLEGREFRVVAPFHGSQKTARRLPVEEVVG